MATSVTDKGERLDDAQTQFISAPEPWLSRIAWLWTLAGLALVLTLLRFAVERP